MTNAFNKEGKKLGVDKIVNTLDLQVRNFVE